MNAPNLRFKEFNDEWKIINLSDLMSFNNGINADKDSYGHGRRFINVLDILNNNSIKYDDIIGSVSVSKSVEDNNKVEYGDLLFLRSSENREDVGKSTVYLDKEKFALFGGFVIRGKKQGDYHPYFLKLNLESPKIRHQIGSKAGGSTRFNVSQSILNSIEVSMPSKAEQKKIAEFLEHFDKKVQLQHDKIKFLKEQKKCYIQKIFSQEKRLKDENGANFSKWFEVRLSDVLISKDIRQVPSDEAPLMAFTSTGGVEPKGERYNREFLVKNANKTYKRTDLNDLIYSSNNLDVGAIGRNKYGTSVISDVYEIFEVKEGYKAEFIEVLIQQKSFLNKVLKFRQGALYGQYRIHASDFLSVSVLLPAFEEQVRLSNFIMKMDLKLNLETDKLETLIQQKQALMQQMFI